MKNKALKVTLIISLIVLVVFLVSYSYAMYRSSTNTPGSLKLADWNVSLNQTGEPDEIDVEAGGSDVSYTVRVKSLSEVDINYSIEVSGLPDDVLVKLDSGEYQTPVNNKVEFNDAGSILYGSGSNQNEHLLYFKAEAGATAVEDQDININVKAEQDL